MELNTRKREWNLSNRYNMTIFEYDTLFEKQKGLCKICKLPERAKLNGNLKRLAVDHCHKTGKIRGLLCNSCNALLAKIGDSSCWLKQAIKYLN